MNIALYGNTVGMAEWPSIHKQLIMVLLLPNDLGRGLSTD